MALRVLQYTSPLQATVDINLGLTTVLNKLRTFCVNNSAKYDRFTWNVGVDVATGQFFITASAVAFPNTFADFGAARRADTYTDGNVAV